jgi:hypothetical protein
MTDNKPTRLKLAKALEKIAAKGSCPNGDIHLQRIAAEALASYDRDERREDEEHGSRSQLWRPISVEALDGQCVEMRMFSTWKAKWTLDEEGHGFFDRVGDAPRQQTEWRPVSHASDCAVHNMPAMPNGPCDCGAESPVIPNQGKPSS